MAIRTIKRMMKFDKNLNLYNKLSSIIWFKNSVRDIRVFKVEDWSDFTEIVKS